MTDTHDWPALMDLDTAGAYLRLAPGRLVSLLRRENVAPVDLGLRLRRWRRADLDELIARLPSVGRLPDTDSCADAKQGVDWALAAVERRSVASRRARRRPREVRQSHPAP
jgi:hypothetical protein